VERQRPMPVPEGAFWPFLEMTSFHQNKTTLFH